jgi:hypothetical protein
MTHRMAVVIVAAAFGATTHPAHADELQAQLEQPLQEISHTVEIRIADGVATYVVQRQFRNPGTIADEARLLIELPEGATATGLRIRAKDTWHEGELLEAKQAAARYRELTGRGIHDPKDPALLFWLGDGELFLQVFPVFPRTVSTVEYTLTAPTRYAEGRYWVTYPRPSRADASSLALANPVISVRGDAPYVVDGKQLARAARTTLAASKRADDRADASNPPTDPGASNLASIGVAPPAIPTWSARLGRVVASDRHAFARLEIDAAPKLSSVPRRAQVVFVVDASYSAGRDLVAAQLAIVNGYLRHVPDAEVELVVYRRTASRVFGTFVGAAKVPRAIDQAMRRGAFALGNGSALDDGARVAAAALVGRKGPHRIVIAGDDLVRSALTEADALASLGALDASAIVHVVSPSAHGEPSLVRDDAARFAPLAARHHGIYAVVSGISAKRSGLSDALLELVRPTRIHNVAATGGFSPDETLAEGEGVRLFEHRTAAAPPSRVTLTGMLWSDPVKLELVASTAFSSATAAFVFGENEHHGLTEPEMMTVALAGRAVSPVTSYLAIEPGVRPSKIGLLGGTGWGTIGTGRYGTVGKHGGIGITRVQPDLKSLIDTRRCVQLHPPAAGWSVKLAIETTKDEIVDVAIAKGRGPLADCLIEAVWSVRLDQRFDRQYESFVVDLF